MKPFAVKVCSAVICFSVYSHSAVNLKIINGTLALGKYGQASVMKIIDTARIDNQDTVLLLETPDVECVLADSIRLFMKDSCCFAVNKKDNKISLNFIKGQLLFVKKPPFDSLFLVESRTCQFIPTGTTAAFKLTKAGNPSVAVVKGMIRMKKNDGVFSDVSEGMYATYNAAANALEPARPIPLQTLAALQAWSEKTPAKPPEDVQSAPKDNSALAVKPAEPVKTAQPVSVEKKADATRQPPPPAQDTAKNEKEPAQQQAQAPVNQEQPAAKQADSAKAEEEKKEEKKKDKAVWEVGAGFVTVDNVQWTRIVFGVDIPIWRFGVGLDIEVFMDQKGNFSNKAWDFSSGRKAGESLLRKIKYVRFNHEADPVFVKLGGLDNVTFGYGFIVDRFTNMLNYPGEKYLGMQFYLNDISPIGITLQTCIPDFMDFGNDGGILAGRLAFRPLKKTSIPILNGVTLGGTVATDLNQYAPAREWDFSLNGSKWDKDDDGITDSTYLSDTYGKLSFYDSIVRYHKRIGDYDTRVEHADEWVKTEVDPVTVIGADLGIPIVKTKLLALDVYAHGGVTVDDESDSKFYKGWGFGAPGVAVTLGPVRAMVEYRHIKDKFTPAYFGPYYFDERITPENTHPITIKEQLLRNVELNGVYGSLGVSIAGFVLVSGSYQWLGGDNQKDQRLEADAEVGEKIIKFIPKITKAQLFYSQTDIDRNFFYQTPTTYWGYRLGVEVLSSAYILWETRYGWDAQLNDKKNVTITAGLRF